MSVIVDNIRGALIHGKHFDPYEWQEIKKDLKIEKPSDVLTRSYVLLVDLEQKLNNGDITAAEGIHSEIKDMLDIVDNDYIFMWTGIGVRVSKPFFEYIFGPRIDLSPEE